MHSWLKWMGPSVLLVGLAGCPAPDGGGGTELLSINPTTRSIDDKGAKTQLRVSAVDAEGNLGKGDVKLTTPAGFFDNDDKSVTLTLDSSGSASIGYSCAVARDSACRGSVRIEGTWGSLTGNTTIQVGGSVAPTDGGTTNPPGNNDAGTAPPVTVPGKPANILFYAEGGTATELGIRSVGLRTATPVVFTVLDLEGKPVANASVKFSVVGPAGVSLVPSVKLTDGDGRASTVLQSGDEVGVATVSGSIEPDSGGTLTASTPAISIIGARVSDRGLVVECRKLILSANMSETPPRKDVTTTCTANLSDRFANLITAKTTVTWYSEAGAISSPTQSTEGAGVATSTFSTAGKWPPVPVAPLTATEAGEAEPTNPDTGKSSYNPRDMLVTIIAVTSGEEEFYDGSGTSNGVKNGQWDKGEWFVDTPEPFVDANDNQVYDFGEAFIDTERVNCANGQLEPKNGKWDGPNGCWDGSTMLWRATHVVYSGYNSLDGARFTGTPPASVPVGGQASMLTKVTDSYLNPISPDNALFLVGTPNTTASVVVGDINDANLRSFGMQIIHERVEITPDSSQPRGYRVVGVCDERKVPSAAASTDPALARCIWRYRFGKFNIRPNVGEITFTGTAKGASSVRLSLGNDYGRAYEYYSTTVQ